MRDMSSSSPRRVRSRFWWVGLLLVLGGLSVLGWVAWQFWGTNWVSQRTHERIVDKVEQEWRADGADGADGAGGNDVVQVPQGKVSALIRIPRFGSDYVVPVIEGTSDAVLVSGYGHFKDSAGPGKRGNYAVTAHRVTHGEPLRRMPDLEPGDEIVVQTRTSTYTYELSTGGDDLVVPFTAGWVLAALPKNPERGGVEPGLAKGQKKKDQRLMTLATCAELFHTDERLVAFAVLTSVE